MSRLKKGSAIAAAAIALIGAWEGLRLNAYRDPVGIPTACYGETHGIRMGMKFTKEQCDEMFLPSIQKHEAGMRACLKDPDAIPASVYVSMVSLTYNVGVGGFCRSSLPALLNAKRYADACHAAVAFNRAGGRVLQGLVNRREDERRRCLKDLR